MMFDHDVEVGKETDILVHRALGKEGNPPPYSSDKKTADALAKELAFDVIPVFETNHTHFFDSLGVLPESEPLGYLALLEVEPTDEGDDLLLMHGWRSLSEGETYALAVCRSVLLMKDVVKPGWIACSPRSAVA